MSINKLVLVLILGLRLIGLKHLRSILSNFFVIFKTKKMQDEICTVLLGNGLMDNDYTVYQSGKIKRFYDRSIYNLNVVEWLDASQIDENTKRRILEKCSPEHKDQVNSVLFGS